MKDYLSMSKEQLHSELHNLTQQYQEYKAMNLNLDMSRGKPCTEQLNLSNELLNIHQYIGENGFDSRNYGMLACRRLVVFLPNCLDFQVWMR